MNQPRRVRIVGPGRAGKSFAAALASVGWDVLDPVGSSDSPADAADGADLVLICTPDRAIAQVAGMIAPHPDVVVAHVSGSLGLDVLAPHTSVAAIHPLMSLSNEQLGRARLLEDGWFAIAGSPLAAQVVADLGGRSFEVADEDRAVYHAAACVASPHVVALLGQVERLAASIGVPAEAFWNLAQGSLDNVRAVGAHDALTGPAARDDQATIDRHLAALDPLEHGTYGALVAEARRLAHGDH